MDPFQDFSRNVAEYERAKRNLRIGLFGSFRREEIHRVRETLRDDHYHVKISSDLVIQSGTYNDANNFTVSMMLVDQCDTHIFLFHREMEGEHNINQSVSMELQYLADSDQSDHALILLEKGYLEQSGGVFIGLKANTLGTWRWETFLNFPTLENAAKKFLFGRVLSSIHSDKQE